MVTTDAPVGFRVIVTLHNRGVGGMTSASAETAADDIGSVVTVLMQVVVGSLHAAGFQPANIMETMDMIADYVPTTGRSGHDTKTEGACTW